MKRTVEYLDELYKSLRYAIRDVMLFPGENLVNVFKLLCILSVLTSVSTIFKLYPFLNFMGVLLATGLVGSVLLLTRRGDKQK